MKYLKAVVASYLFFAVTYLLLPLGVQADLRSYAISLVSRDLTFLSAASNIIPGATSLSLRNAANSASNITVTDAGLIAIPRAKAGNTSNVVIGESALTTDQINWNTGAALTVFSDAATLDLYRGSANNSPARMVFGKTRAVTGVATTIVQSGDKIGGIDFVGADGANFVQAGAIIVTVDGTPGTNDMPGAIDFQLSPDGSATMASVLKLTNDKLATFAGKITSSATADLGWAVKSGANTACNTTCTSACVFGIDTGSTTNSLLACTDATADICLCAGAS